MIETKVEVSKELEKALRELEQAKQHLEKQEIRSDEEENVVEWSSREPNIQFDDKLPFRE